MLNFFIFIVLTSASLHYSNGIYITSERVPTLKIISKSEWRAAEPLNPPEYLDSPVDKVIILNTGGENCDSKMKCTILVRHIQYLDIETKSKDDISFNFLIGGDGSIFEGSGWDKIGGFIEGYNLKSMTMALIGTFLTDAPPKVQLDALKNLINEGKNKYKITRDFKLYSYRKFNYYFDSGPKLYDLLPKWDNYYDN